jgi:hypothetical protein
MEEPRLRKRTGYLGRTKTDGNRRENCLTISVPYLISRNGNGTRIARNEIYWIMEMNKYEWEPKTTSDFQRS